MQAFSSAPVGIKSDSADTRRVCLTNSPDTLRRTARRREAPCQPAKRRKALCQTQRKAVKAFCQIKCLHALSSFQRTGPLKDRHQGVPADSQGTPRRSGRPPRNAAKAFRQALHDVARRCRRWQHRRPLQRPFPPVLGEPSKVTSRHRGRQAFFRPKTTRLNGLRRVTSSARLGTARCRAVYRRTWRPSGEPFNPTIEELVCQLPKARSPSGESKRQRCIDPTSRSRLCQPCLPERLSGVPHARYG